MYNKRVLEKSKSNKKNNTQRMIKSYVTNNKKCNNRMIEE